MPTKHAAIAAEVSKYTIISWYTASRKVCTKTQMALPKMLGKQEEQIQVHESYFSKSRKYNRVRLRQGETRTSNETKVQEESDIELDVWGSSDPSEYECDEFHGPPTLHNNYSSRTSGPWVVGLYMNCHEVRFFMVFDRKVRHFGVL